METNNTAQTAEKKMEVLITYRPGAFRSTIWYGALRIIYFIAGLGTLIYSIYTVCIGYASFEIITELKKDPEQVPQISQHSEVFFPEKSSYFMLPAALFLLSIALFILAHYCRKVIRRNQYIIELENTWKEIDAVNKLHNKL